MDIPSAPLSVVIIIEGLAKMSIVEVVEESLETGNELGVPVLGTCNAVFSVFAEAILSVPEVIGELCEKDRELDRSMDSFCDMVFDNVVEAGMASVAELAADPRTWLELLLKADPLTPTPRKLAGRHDFNFGIKSLVIDMFETDVLPEEGPAALPNSEGLMPQKGSNRRTMPSTSMERTLGELASAVI